MKTFLKVIRKDNYPLLLLIPIFVYYILGLTDSWIPSADSAVYISLGKSLISGDGYTLMGRPHAVSTFMFPLILAPVIGLFGKNFLLMRLISVLVGVASLGLVYLLFKHVLGPRWGLVLMLLTGMNEYHYYFSHYILSETPYTLFSLSALWYFTRNQGQSKSMFVLAGLILAAYFTRTVGTALFVGVFLFGLIEIRGRLSQAVLLLLIFIIPFGIGLYHDQTLSTHPRLSSVHEEQRGYFEFLFFYDQAKNEKGFIGFGDITRRISRNIKQYRIITTNLIISKHFSTLNLTRIIPAILVIGFLSCWFKRRSVVEYYLFPYILACLMWPSSTPGPRYFIPIISFIIYYFLSGTGFISDCAGKLFRLSERRKKSVREGVIAVVIIILSSVHMVVGWQAVKFLREESYLGGAKKNFLASIKWVTNNTGADDIFISDRAPWVYLLSDRKTYGYARVEDSAEVLRSIHHQDPDYIISSRITGYGRYLDRALADYPHLFTEVYREGDSAVYRVIAEGEGSLSLPSEGGVEINEPDIDGVVPTTDD